VGFKDPQVPPVLPVDRGPWIALFPVRNPTTCDTADFGGVAISMCTASVGSGRGVTPVFPLFDDSLPIDPHERREWQRRLNGYRSSAAAPKALPDWASGS
jgi:hypothetical protein